MDRKFEGWSGRCGARRSAVLLACVAVALTVGLVASLASSAPSFAGPRVYPAGSTPFWVAVGDLNGDGKADLATANYENTVSVLLNRGDGSFQANLEYATGRIPYSVAIGDLNGDGKADLATANSENTVSVLLNRGDGSFQAKLEYATGRSPRSLAIGDLNGDGMPDLVTANAGANSVSVLLNSGDGTLQAKFDYATGEGTLSVAVGDVNGDGKPDLATANYNTVSVFLNATGRCVVPSVRGMTLLAARRTIARADCRTGRIRPAYSNTVKRGRVMSQKPRPSRVLPRRGRVNLVVSRGRKR